MLSQLCLPSGGRQDDDAPDGAPGPFHGQVEDLPFRVEIWDPTNSYVEQVIAVAAHATIGYAAYYAAVREDLDRHIALSRKGEVLIRWSPRSH